MKVKVPVEFEITLGERTDLRVITRHLRSALETAEAELQESLYEYLASDSDEEDDPEVDVAFSIGTLIDEESL